MKARGERAQDYGARRLHAAQAQEHTAGWEEKRRKGLLAPVFWPIACTCPRYPFPHLHEKQLFGLDSKST